MKVFSGFAALCLAASTSIALSQESKPLTNEDVINLVRAGLSAEVIKAKIATSTTQFATDAEALAQLKAAKVPDEVVVAMLTSGSSAATPKKPGRVIDQLSTDYKKLQNAVVTVWSETGHGTGFIVDPKGLILTNQHVVGPSEYVAVQFDGRRKILARLLEADAAKDVAVLWADTSIFQEAITATIATSKPMVEEGEKVFTIGSPLSQRKILTTGVASKVEERAIISDININPGNSGGPLFNSVGEVVGLATFIEKSGGPGISGIVRIEEALPLLERSRARLAEQGAAPPEPMFLPVEPPSRFPVQAVKTASTTKKADASSYVFGIKDYDIGVITPLLMYRQSESEREAVESHKKRTKAKEADGAFNPASDLYNWAEYADAFQAVVTIRARPKLRETFWSGMSRGLAAAGGAYYLGQANMKFKSDFRKMELLCGNNVVLPIQPGRIPHLIDLNNAFVKATDATYEGLYSYPIDAFSPQCGEVTLKVYPVKDSEVIVKTVDKKIVDRVWADFEAWRAAQ